MTPATPTGRPWAIYARLSDDKGAEQTATARQIADCRRYADQHGLATSEQAIYEDVDLSAFRRVDRPAFEQLLRDLDARLLAGVLCWKLDRLTRNHRDFERIWGRLERHGAKLVSIHEQFDTSTPAGEFALRTLIGLARMESQNISLRIRSRLEEQRNAGKPHAGAHRPYGYAPDFVTIDPAEAAVLHEAHARLLAGESLRALVADLNARGLRSAEGRPWTPRLLARIMTNPRLAGWRVHWRRLEDGSKRRVREVVAKGTWEPIFTQAEHEAIVALFADPARRSQVRRPRTHLLSGLARCGYPTPGGEVLLPDGDEVCGAPMYAQSHGRSRPLDYRCLAPPTGHGCGRVSIQAPPVDELVVAAAIAFVDGPGLAELLRRLERDDGQGALSRDQEALEQLAQDYYVTRIISREEYLAAREVLEAKLQRARARLERQQGAALLAGLAGRTTPLADAWVGYSVDQRRAVLEALFRAVVVLPAPRPGPRLVVKDRVRLAWRVQLQG